ncbi:MAG: hypothetical protein BroJett025_02170 [Patescibacteria group bacterium]|nr:MAG: hypothetical protein BroJett025_02170 [Patescibacteria group bacterium]
MKRLLLLLVLITASFLLSACNPLAKKAKSGLQVQITDGVAASVYLDETYVEKTPFISRELNPGEYTLKIQPDDPKLIPYETRISLKPGLLTVVTWKLAERPEFSGGVMYEMEPINAKGKSEVSFVTIPDGAIVTVAGKEKTFSPVIMSDINPGHVEFEVSLPSYGIQKHTINAIPGYRMLVTVKLAKENVAGAAVTSSSDETEQQATNAATTPAPLATASATPVAATDSATPKLNTTGRQVQITSTNFFVEGKEVLRVRDAPNSSGKELGFADVGSLHPYIGNSQNGWLNIQFNGQSGWVSNQYAQLVQ